MTDNYDASLMADLACMVKEAADPLVNALVGGVGGAAIGGVGNVLVQRLLNRGTKAKDVDPVTQGVLGAALGGIAGAGLGYAGTNAYNWGELFPSASRMAFKDPQSGQVFRGDQLESVARAQHAIEGSRSPDTAWLGPSDAGWMGVRDLGIAGALQGGLRSRQLWRKATMTPGAAGTTQEISVPGSNGPVVVKNTTNPVDPAAASRAANILTGMAIGANHGINLWSLLRRRWQLQSQLAATQQQ